MNKLLGLIMLLASTHLHAANGPAFEKFFKTNATPEKLGISSSSNGVKTKIQLIRCDSIKTGYEEGYGICTFQASGFMLNSVYAVIVNPGGYDNGFAEAVEVGNFLP